MSDEPRDQGLAPGGGANAPDAGEERRSDRGSPDSSPDPQRGNGGGAGRASEQRGGGGSAGSGVRGGDARDGDPRNAPPLKERTPGRRQDDRNAPRPSSVRRAIRDELQADQDEHEEGQPGPQEHPGADRPQPVIELDHVYLAFDQPILEDVSFAAHEGETIALVGESGTGKSTALKLILRLLVPDRGHVCIDGQDITELSFNEALLVRQKMGMVFQGAALFDSMTVFENIAYPLREHTELNEDEIEARVREKLEFVDLEPDRVMQQLPSELSGGMRKRVGIARGMANNPEIMLYDEPTSGLDPLTTGTITRLIMKLQRELGVTSIVVSHDIRSANRMASYIALLAERRIKFFGTPEEMASSDDKYIQDFLGGL
jgi:phospholipid/cholesterol/gamma-HCH transport system ATP-binding protein